MDNQKTILDAFSVRISDRTVKASVMPSDKTQVADGDYSPCTDTARIPVTDSCYARCVRMHEASHAIWTSKPPADCTGKDYLEQGILDALIHLRMDTPGVPSSRMDELVYACHRLGKTVNAIKAGTAHNSALTGVDILKVGAILSKAGCPKALRESFDKWVAKYHEQGRDAVKAILSAIDKGEFSKAKSLASKLFANAPMPPQKGKASKDPSAPKAENSDKQEKSEKSEKSEDKPKAEKAEKADKPKAEKAESDKDESDESDSGSGNPEDSDESDEDESESGESGQPSDESDESDESSDSSEDSDESSDSSGDGNESESDGSDEGADADGDESGESDSDGDESGDDSDSDSDSDGDGDGEPSDDGDGDEADEENDGMGEHGKDNKGGFGGGSETREDSDEAEEDEVDFEDDGVIEPVKEPDYRERLQSVPAELKKSEEVAKEEARIRDSEDGAVTEVAPYQLKGKSKNVRYWDAEKGTFETKEAEYIVPKMYVHTLDANVPRRVIGTGRATTRRTTTGLSIRGNRLALAAASPANNTRLFERKLQGGTVLLDASGSMSISDAQLYEIAEKVPAGKVAYYSGTSGDYTVANPPQDNGYGHKFEGHLVVYADRGKIRKNRYELPHRCGGNLVDFHAIWWLLQQPAPRFCMTDTGFTDAFAPEAHALYNMAVERKLIVPFRNMEELMRFVRGGGREEVTAQTPTYYTKPKRRSWKRRY